MYKQKSKIDTFDYDRCETTNKKKKKTGTYVNVNELNDIGMLQILEFFHNIDFRHQIDLVLRICFQLSMIYIFDRDPLFGDIMVADINISERT